MSMTSTRGPRTDRAITGQAQAPKDLRAARRYGGGFWAVAAVFGTAMAFSTVPTPLYPLYQARDGFSTFTVTLVFAVYAVGVLASLLLAGHVSDWLGRRKVVMSALALELLAAALFLATPSLPALFAARLVTGLGVGMLTATATAYLQELHGAHRPGASTRRFEIVSTMANIGGLGLGPLAAGVLAQYLGAPLRLPYAVFVVLLLGGMAAVALAPETVRPPKVRPAYRPQRIGAARGKRGYLAAAAAAFTSMAVFGLFTSVVPGFVGATLHHPSRALAGLVVFAVLGAAAVAQTGTGRLGARVRWNLGLLAQGVGMAALAIGMHLASLPVFLIAGITAGAGAGVLFKSAVGYVATTAAPARRGEALTGLFLASYLGLALLPLGLGVTSRLMSLIDATTWFTLVVLALLAAVTFRARHHGPSAPSGPAPAQPRPPRAMARVANVPSTDTLNVRDERRHRGDRSGALRAAVFGVNDGLVSNTALVMGFAGSGASGSAVLFASVAGLLAGAFSMAAGEYISMRSQREAYEREIALEAAHLHAHPSAGTERLALIYRAKGLDAPDARHVATAIMEDPDAALNTMVREELGLDPDELGSPWSAALSSLASFAVGAVTVVLPYLLTSGTAALVSAVALAAGALFTVGSVIGRLNGRAPLRSGARQLLVGAGAAAAVFGIGHLIGTGAG
jgi:VIT1/CCC1 family predicted Fe2+/Mn2+ transporter/predicted MFS family arabinose efflux permease